MYSIYPLKILKNNILNAANGKVCWPKKVEESKMQDGIIFTVNLDKKCILAVVTRTTCAGVVVRGIAARGADVAYSPTTLGGKGYGCILIYIITDNSFLGRSDSAKFSSLQCIPLYILIIQ